MLKNLRVFTIFAAAMVASIAVEIPAQAVTVYNYSGYGFNSFSDGSTNVPGITYTTADRVSFSLTLISPLPSNFSGNVKPYLASYAATDAHYTHNGNNATLGSFFSSTPFVATNSAGNIVQWDLQSILVLSALEANITRTSNLGAGSIDLGFVTLQCTPPCNGTLVSRGEISAAPGSWQTAPVPEARTSALLGFGLLALLIMRQVSVRVN